MPSPFPGMDPWLENPALWPDVHNSLIAALRDDLAARVSPRYFVAIEERTYLEEPDELVLVGRPDLTVATADRSQPLAAPASATTSAAVVEVRVPVADRIRDTWIEVRRVAGGEAVTVIEVLSYANKRAGDGRRDYLRKRTAILSSLTSLVEIDLLRAPEPMPVIGLRPPSAYAVLVSRSWQRPRAHLMPIGLRDPLPLVTIPLREGEPEPSVDLGALFAALYDRARYDLQVSYATSPVPALTGDDGAWAAVRIAQVGSPR